MKFQTFASQVRDQPLFAQLVTYLSKFFQNPEFGATKVSSLTASGAVSAASLSAASIKVLAGGNLLPVLYNMQVGAANASGQALTTTQTDLTGATVTLTAVNPGFLISFGSVSINESVTGTGLNTGRLVVDGSVVSQFPFDTGAGTGNGGGPMFDARSVAAGAHTVKLQAAKGAAGGTSAAGGNSRVVAVLVEFSP